MTDGNLDDLSMSKGLEKLVARNLNLLGRESREDSLDGASIKPEPKSRKQTMFGSLLSMRKRKSNQSEQTANDKKVKPMSYMEPKIKKLKEKKKHL